MARIMRSALALTALLTTVANAQLPSLSPFPSPLPPFNEPPASGGSVAPMMLPVNPPNTPVEPFAPPPGPPLDPLSVPPPFIPVPTSEPMMPTMEAVLPTMPPHMMPGMEPSMAPFVPMSPEPSMGIVMPGVSAEPSMPGMMMGPSMEPSMDPFSGTGAGAPVLPVAPVRTPPVARCPSTCRLSVGPNARFNINSPQDESMSLAVTGPNFVTALEVGEALVDGRPISSYGLPATTFGLWPIGLTNKFGIGHRTVEMGDRPKLYNRCVTLPITRYISGTTNPVLVNSRNTAVDCVSFYLTPKPPVVV